MLFRSGGGYYGGGIGGGVYMPPGGGMPPGGNPPGGPAPNPPGGNPPAGGGASAPATIAVNLPANAQLFVDGVATKSTSSSRTLVTPNLSVGQQYTYTLKAQADINGQTVTQEQQVTVTGGQQTPVTFTFNNTGVATSNK